MKTSNELHPGMIGYMNELCNPIMVGKNEPSQLIMFYPNELLHETV